MCSDANLFVRPIPVQFGEDDIRKEFEPFGKIQSIRLPNDRENPGNHRGFAYVSYTSSQSAMKAIINLNGRQKFGRIITVDYFKPKSQRVQEQQELRQPHNVYIDKFGFPYYDWQF